MRLDQITYSLLETIREGSIVDDDKLDIRLIEDFVRVKRTQYLEELANSSKYISENNIQEYVSTIGDTTYNGFDVRRTTYKIPRPLSSRFGFLIPEIATLDFKVVPFTLVNNKHFRYVGEGKFNTSHVYGTYRQEYLYLKSKDSTFESVDSCVIRLVAEVPEDVPGFNVTTDNYPIDLQGINYIKQGVLRGDLIPFLQGVADTTNNADGIVTE